MEGFKLNDKDVVSMETTKSIVSCSTFKAMEAALKMKNKFSHNDNLQLEAHYFTNEGVDCEVLKADGKGWRKGRVRFRLEFIPDDEPVPKSTDAVLGGSE